MKFRLLFAVLFSFPVAVFAVPNVGHAPIKAPAVTAQSPLAATLQQGHAALARKDYEGADKLFRQASEMAPKSTGPWLGLAESARVRGDAESARKALQQALVVGPGDAAALTAWARWEYTQRNYEQAEQYWNKALKADPKSTGALVDLGDFYFNMRGQFSEAADYYRRALRIDDKLAGAHYAFGVALTRTGKAEEGRKALERSAVLSPDNPLPLYALGQNFALAGEPANAVKALDRALKVQPTFYPARLEKGDALIALGRQDAAMAEYQAVIKSNPRVAQPHVRAGMLLQRQGRVADAFSAYQSALAIEPELPVALNNLAWLAADRPDIADRGLAWAEKAVALQPGDPRVVGTLAWVHFKRGEGDKAIALLHDVVKGAGKDLAESHYLLGRVAAERGDKDAARSALHEALRLDPKFRDAAEAQALLKRLAGS